MAIHAALERYTGIAKSLCVPITTRARFIVVNIRARLGIHLILM
jgi:hypothetical protein